MTLNLSIYLVSFNLGNKLSEKTVEGLAKKKENIEGKMLITQGT